MNSPVWILKRFRATEVKKRDEALKNIRDLTKVIQEICPHPDTSETGKKNICVDCGKNIILEKLVRSAS